MSRAAPRRSHPQVKSPLRFCLSCCLTLTCWAAWLVLGGALLALAYVAVVREFPLPDFVLRRIEARLADANLALRFDRVRFDPTGKLLLEGVTVRSPRFEEPLLSSRLVYVEGSVWGFSIGQRTPAEIRLEGATLQLPAMLSPGGTAEPILRDLAATLRPGPEGVWQVDQLVFRAGPIAVTAHGNFILPRRPDAAPLTLADLVTRYLQTGRLLAQRLPLLDACDSPSLAVELAAQPGIGNTASLLFTARTVQLPAGPLPAPVTLDQLAATTTLRLDGGGDRPARLHVAARALDAKDRLAARDVRTILLAQLDPAGFRFTPQELWLTAATMTASGETVGAPVFQANLAGWPQIRLEASLLAGAEAIAAEVEARLREQSALVHLAGRAAPDFVNDLLARRTPRFAPWLVLGDPLAFDAQVSFAPGWKFTGLDATVAGGRIDSRNVAITAVAGRLKFDGRELIAHNAVLRAGENLARGSYRMDVRSRDYRMLLQGRLRPLEIGGWFRPGWWQNLWDDFDFSAAAPAADVDVAGRWTDPRLSRNFIAADTDRPRVRGADFDRVRTTLFVRPQFMDGWMVEARRAGGAQTLSGSFVRHFDLAERVMTGAGFDIDSTVETRVLEQLSAGAFTPFLDEWRFNRPPHLHFTGAWSRREGGGHTEMTFTGAASDGLHYYGFPLDTLHASGGLSGTALRLDDIRFTVAGGQGRGKASLGGPRDARRLGFDVSVQNAGLGPTVSAVQEYEGARSGTAAKAGSESRFLQRAHAARLDVGLSAQGEPGLLDTFQGSGNAQLTGATLSEVHLLGLLSQVLSGLSLNFSTMKLDTVHSSFTVAGGRLHFPDLKVTGSSGAVIDAKGDYTLASNSLNFTARFRPYAERRNILTGPLGLVLNPLSSIIELKLTGPLAQPVWSYAIGQSAAPSQPVPSQPAKDLTETDSAPATKADPAPDGRK